MLIDNYYNNENVPDYSYPLHSRMIKKFRKNKEVLEPLCEKLGVNIHTGVTAFYICITKETKEICKKWLTDGNSHGVGKGFFVYDSVNKDTLK